MSYSIWGYSMLANRYVKQIGSRESRSPVTPGKVQALRKSFKEWLQKHGYQNQALFNELNQLNVYLSRAPVYLTGARRHLKMDAPQQRTTNVSNENESSLDSSQQHTTASKSFSSQKDENESEHSV